MTLKAHENQQLSNSYFGGARRGAARGLGAARGPRRAFRHAAQLEGEAMPVWNAAVVSLSPGIIHSDTESGWFIATSTAVATLLSDETGWAGAQAAVDDEEDEDEVEDLDDDELDEDDEEDLEDEDEDDLDDEDELDDDDDIDLDDEDEDEEE